MATTIPSAALVPVTTRSDRFHARWAPTTCACTTPFPPHVVGDLTLHFDVLPLPADPGLPPHRLQPRARLTSRGKTHP